jgi:hypothetical protein
MQPLTREQGAIIWSHAEHYFKPVVTLSIDGHGRRRRNPHVFLALWSSKAHITATTLLAAVDHTQTQ